MSELPNRCCCSLCFSWDLMCSTCYGRMKQDSTKGEIIMCKCKGAKFQPQCCPKCSDGHGNSRVDWDKPIQCRTRTGRVLPLKYVGWHLGGTIVDFGNLTTGTSSLHYAEKVTLGTIENVPESKSEKWINVYWHHDLKKVIQSCMYPTYQEAREGGINSSKEVNRLGTFQVN